MKKSATAFAMIAVAFVSLLALAGVVSAEDPLTVAVVAPIEAPVQRPAEVVPVVEVHEPVEPPGTGKLGGYVLEAMLKWTAGRDAAPATHKAEIAIDIAWTALAEPRIWDKSDGSREALVLASIGFQEGRFRDYLEQCNDPAWAKTKEGRALLLLGDCDGARSGYAQAVGHWQVHFDCGAVHLYEDGSWANACNAADRTRLHWTITKAQAIVSRRDLARVALAMARQSIRQCGGTLNCYVGGDGPERARMASQRLDLGLRWARLHPFSP